MHQTAVINIVGLTSKLIGDFTPRLRGFLERGKLAAVETVLPAVTTSVQATYLTGTWPSEHGIVGNGWYFRDQSEVHFWKQSDALVQRRRVWEMAKAIDPSFTCANLFWWYAMYSGADYTVTPRPMYPADGRKLPDVWTNPGVLREALQEELGQFPLFKFWGPATSIECSQWIADAAVRVDRKYRPSLNLIYLPHLDYCLQQRGPGAAENARGLREIDGVFGKLLDHFEAAGVRVMVLSEYGMSAVSRPIHLNRVLREHGLITVREEQGLEFLDAGASRAFAVADHQVAHVYVKNPSYMAEVREILERTAGVGRVLDEAGKREAHIDHARAGEFVVIAKPDSWFTYYFWQDDALAPDYARTVDIHRKPGYDPVELFLDPRIRLPMVKIGSTLLKRKMGLRAMLDVIPLDANLVKGSHGAGGGEEGPVAISSWKESLSSERISPTDVCGLILRHLFG